jgi:hypothetical protein
MNVLVSRACGAELGPSQARPRVDLNGMWQFRMDPNNQGETERWFEAAGDYQSGKIPLGVSQCNTFHGQVLLPSRSGEHYTDWLARMHVLELQAGMRRVHPESHVFECKRVGKVDPRTNWTFLRKNVDSSMVRLIQSFRIYR